MEFDAIVVGSGATGGWAAKELAASGLRVCVLEAGPLFEHMRRRSSAEPFEKRFAIQTRLPICSAPHRHLFVDDVDHPYTTPDDRPFTWIRGRVVGGRMRTWGRVSLRISEHDLTAPERDGIGEPWPISYAELAPFYDEVETFLEVAGSREQLPWLPDGQFVAPVCEATDGFQRLRGVVQERFSGMRAIPGRVALGEAAATLGAALATGNVTLRTDAIACRVLADRDGRRARGIAFVDRVTKQTHEVLGRVVVLAASAIETARLLLLSAPGGLGNASDVLGRNLMDHVQVSAGGTMPGLRPAADAQDLAGTCYIPRFRNVGGASAAFARGYGIHANVQGSAFGGAGPVFFYLMGMGEMLPNRDNRVTLDPEVVDAWGIPAARISCAHGENEVAMAKDQQAVLAELVAALGFELFPGHELARAVPGATVHEVGTARMGASPKTSYLNAHNQAWEVPNLYVVDGSCFTTSSWQSPTLTMMALAVRAARHIVGELERMNL